MEKILTEDDFKLLEKILTDFIKLQQKEMMMMQNAAKNVDKMFPGLPAHIKEMMDEAARDMLNKDKIAQEDIYEEIILLKAKLVQLKRQLILSEALGK